MSTLKKLGSFFFEVEEKQNTTFPKPGNVINKKPVPIIEKTNYSENISDINKESITKYKLFFNKIMEEENKRNFPGHDYFEFKQMKNAMNMIPDETLQYQSAFAGIKISGINKEKLLSTAEEYIKVVDKEIKEFEEGYNTVYNQKVGTKKTLVENKTNEIQKLTETIQKLSEEVNQLNIEIFTDIKDLDSDKEAFLSVGLQYKEEIKQEIEKIKQYIN